MLEANLNFPAQPIFNPSPFPGSELGQSNGQYDTKSSEKIEARRQRSSSEYAELTTRDEREKYLLQVFGPVLGEKYEDLVRADYIDRFVENYGTEDEKRNQNVKYYADMMVAFVDYAMACVQVRSTDEWKHYQRTYEDQQPSTSENVRYSTSRPGRKHFSTSSFHRSFRDFFNRLRLGEIPPANYPSFVVILDKAITIRQGGVTFQTKRLYGLELMVAKPDNLDATYLAPIQSPDPHAPPEIQQRDRRIGSFSNPLFVSNQKQDNQPMVQVSFIQDDGTPVHAQGTTYKARVSYTKQAKSIFTNPSDGVLRVSGTQGLDSVYAETLKRDGNFKLMTTTTVIVDKHGQPVRDAAGNLQYDNLSTSRLVIMNPRFNPLIHLAGILNTGNDADFRGKYFPNKQLSPVVYSEDEKDPANKSHYPPMAPVGGIVVTEIADVFMKTLKFFFGRVRDIPLVKGAGAVTALDNVAEVFFMGNMIQALAKGDDARLPAILSLFANVDFIHLLIGGFGGRVASTIGLRTAIRQKLIMFAMTSADPTAVEGVITQDIVSDRGSGIMGEILANNAWDTFQAILSQLGGVALGKYWQSGNPEMSDRQKYDHGSPPSAADVIKNKVSPDISLIAEEASTNFAKHDVNTSAADLLTEMNDKIKDINPNDDESKAQLIKMFVADPTSLESQAYAEALQWYYAIKTKYPNAKFSYVTYKDKRGTLVEVQGERLFHDSENTENAKFIKLDKTAQVDTSKSGPNKSIDIDPSKWSDIILQGIESGTSFVSSTLALRAISDAYPGIMFEGYILKDIVNQIIPRNEKKDSNSKPQIFTPPKAPLEQILAAYKAHMVKDEKSLDAIKYIQKELTPDTPKPSGEVSTSNNSNKPNLARILGNVSFQPSEIVQLVTMFATFPELKLLLKPEAKYLLEQNGILNTEHSRREFLFKSGKRLGRFAAGSFVRSLLKRFGY